MAKDYTVVPIELTEARARERYPKRGRYFKVIASTSADAYVEISVEDTEGSYIKYKVGDSYRSSDEFETIYLRNASQGGESVELLITDGSAEVGIASRGQIDGIAQPVVTKGGNTLNNSQVDVLDGIEAVAIINAAAATTGFFIKNHVDSVGTLYLGEADTVDETDGFPLLPGEAISWDLGDTVYAFADGGDCDVRILRGSKV